MPETCEVYIIAECLTSKFKNCYITNVEILSGKYHKKGLEGLDDMIKKLPMKLINVNSRGKLMWFELMDCKDDRFFIINSFGLSGLWHDEKSDNSRISLTLVDNKNNINKIYFTDSRNFGNITLTDDAVVCSKKINSISEDFIRDQITFDNFNKLLNVHRNKKHKIIKVLLDQTGGIGSGLGNYMCVEILYRAMISPHTALEDICSNSELTLLLYEKIMYVVKLCLLTNTSGYMDHIKDYVKHYRELINNGSIDPPLKHIDIANDTFEYLVYQQKKDKYGNSIISENIVETRNTYWCPDIQVN
jgi:formamidopyrimidine-DNA glycosylase